MAAGADFGADGEAVNSVRGRGANVNRLRARSCFGPSGQAEPTDYLPACFVFFAWSAAGTVPPWGGGGATSRAFRRRWRRSPLTDAHRDLGSGGHVRCGRPSRGRRRGVKASGAWQRPPAATPTVVKRAGQKGAVGLWRCRAYFPCFFLFFFVAPPPASGVLAGACSALHLSQRAWSSFTFAGWADARSLDSPMSVARS